MNDQDYEHYPETLFLGQANGAPLVQVVNDSHELAIVVKQMQFDEVAKALFELVMHMENIVGQS